MRVLITGGLGYIGSHTTVELFKQNDEIIVVDNLINSRIEILDQIKKISGRKPKYYNVDVLDKENLDKVFKENQIDAVIHFAALKAVGESVEKPLEYYHNNISGTINLLNVMRENNVKKIIFSSSATVYGDSEVMPVHEELPLMPATNPYGKTKVMMEEILTDVQKSDDEWDVVLLRYFNPVGAHESGLIGELPSGIPSNLMPYVSKVAAGELECLNVFGDDYDTIDGTGVRDYIHVVDLAKGHVAAINLLRERCNLKVYNLGTGNGYSVLEVIKAFEKASGKKVNYKIAPRRAGDIGTCYAIPTKIEKELGWKAEKDIDDMCKDFWRWQNIGLKEVINKK